MRDARFDTEHLNPPNANTVIDEGRPRIANYWQRVKHPPKSEALILIPFASLLSEIARPIKHTSQY